MISCSNPRSNNRFFSPPNRAHQFWSPSRLLLIGDCCCMPGVKRAGRDADHSLPSSVEGKNSQAIPLRHLYAFMVWTGITLLFYSLMRLKDWENPRINATKNRQWSGSNLNGEGRIKLNKMLPLESTCFVNSLLGFCKWNSVGSNYVFLYETDMLRSGLYVLNSRSCVTVYSTEELACLGFLSFTKMLQFESSLFFQLTPVQCKTFWWSHVIVQIWRSN
jgi:hypothetical protein